MNKRKIRLTDIARQAGVSTATVDRVLNERPGVKAHTAERIHNAIKQLENASGGKTGSLAGSILYFDFIIPAGSNTFMQNLQNAITGMGDKLRANAIIVRSHRIHGFDAQALAESIRKVGPHSNGLAVVALDNPIVREAVNEMVDRGIPVVTLVSDLPNSRRLAYVGLDNRSAGRTAGYLMGRFANAGTGNVVLIAGSIGLSYRDHQEREFGFRDSLSEQFPNLTIAERIDNQDDFEKAYEQICKILDQGKNIIGIYNIGAGNRGIGHALQERGLAQDTIFIGHEITSYSRQFLIEGVMDAVINQDVDHETNETLRLLIGHHVGNTQMIELGPPKVEVLLRENLP
ncbi:MAG: LacI family DNA-binding transcriptional regulator [Rhodospirillales bacterium]|nr:LacI family DNA-binding transcriptional regulator [Rhodospirillales bacterium]